MRTELKRAAGKLDMENYLGAARSFQQHAIAVINFINYNNALYLQRKRFGPLLPEIKTAFKRRASELVQDIQNTHEAFNQIMDMWHTSGLAAAYDHHIPTLFELDPKFAVVRRAGLSIGISDHHLELVSDKLKGAGFNPFRVNGADGTLASFASHFENGFKYLENYGVKMSKHAKVAAHATVSTRESGDPDPDPDPTNVNGGEQGGGDSGGGWEAAADAAVILLLIPICAEGNEQACDEIVELTAHLFSKH